MYINYQDLSRQNGDRHDHAEKNALEGTEMTGKEVL